MPPIQGSPSDLTASSGNLAAASDHLGNVSAALGGAFAPLGSWQGAGKLGAESFLAIAQENFSSAVTALNTMHAAIATYSTEVEEAQEGWERSNLEEEEFKAELSKDETELAQRHSELAQQEAHLSSVLAANAAAEAAYTVAKSLSGIDSAAPAAPTPQPTGEISGQISWLKWRIGYLDQEISELKQKIQIRETWKTEYEDRAKAASAKVTSEVNDAQKAWPDIYTSEPSWLDACIAGYVPPPTPSPGFLQRFVDALPKAAVIVGTVAVTIPLDETGAGETIDAEVAAGEISSDAADIGARTDLGDIPSLGGKTLSESTYENLDGYSVATSTTDAGGHVLTVATDDSIESQLAASQIHDLEADGGNVVWVDNSRADPVNPASLAKVIEDQGISGPVTLTSSKLTMTDGYASELSKLLGEPVTVRPAPS